MLHLFFRKITDWSLGPYKIVERIFRPRLKDVYETDYQ